MISERMVTKVLRTIQANEERATVQDDSVDVLVGGRNYTVYLIPAAKSI